MFAASKSFSKSSLLSLAVVSGFLQSLTRDVITRSVYQLLNDCAVILFRLIKAWREKKISCNVFYLFTFLKIPVAENRCKVRFDSFMLGKIA